MKATKIIYWISTTIIFLFQGLMPAFFSRSEEAVKAMQHLGYPDYFNAMLTVFKVVGGLVLIIPRVPRRAKEWAYAGFSIDFIAASVSYFVVDGAGGYAIFPLIAWGILIISYITYSKLQGNITRA